MSVSPYAISVYRYENINIVSVSFIRYYLLSNEIAIYGYLNGNRSEIAIYSFLLSSYRVYHI